jgi:uncharacterized protein YbcI
MKQSKGQIEAAITEEIVKFEQEFMGRGPTGCRTYLIDDLVVIHLTGTLTQGEYQLTKALATVVLNGGFQESKTREMVKAMRRELLEKGRPLLEKAITSLTGQAIVSMHTDLSTINGDRVIVFLLAGPPSILQ